MYIYMYIYIYIYVCIYRYICWFVFANKLKKGSCVIFERNVFMHTFLRMRVSECADPEIRQTRKQAHTEQDSAGFNKGPALRSWYLCTYTSNMCVCVYICGLGRHVLRVCVSLSLSLSLSLLCLSLFSLSLSGSVCVCVCVCVF